MQKFFSLPKTYLVDLNTLLLTPTKNKKKEKQKGTNKQAK